MFAGLPNNNCSIKYLIGLRNVAKQPRGMPKTTIPGGLLLEEEGESTDSVDLLISTLFASMVCVELA